MLQNQKGLTILESLAVMAVSVGLLWVAVPVLMVRLGYKDAGTMVVTEGDKAPDYKGEPLPPDVLKPRVEISPKFKIIGGDHDSPSPPPALPKKPLE